MDLIVCGGRSHAAVDKLPAVAAREFEFGSLQQFRKPDFPKPEIGHSAKSGDRWVESGPLHR